MRIERGGKKEKEKYLGRREKTKRRGKRKEKPGLANFLASISFLPAFYNNRLPSLPNVFPCFFSPFFPRQSFFLPFFLSFFLFSPFAFFFLILPSLYLFISCYFFLFFSLCILLFLSYSLSFSLQISPFFLSIHFPFSPFWAADPKGTMSYRTEG